MAKPGRPAVVSTRGALHAGLNANRLRRSDVAHPFRGVNTFGEVTALMAYRVRLRPGQFFSHQTAAELYGMPLPGATSEVHVSVVAPRTPPRAAGVVGHTVGPDVERLLLADGTPLCGVPDVWCQLAGRIEARDLVAAGDHVVGSRSRPALATLDDLRRVSSRMAGGRGSRDRSWALEQIRWGSDSRPESLLRLVLESLDIGRILVNEPLDVGGLTLYRDLAVPSRGLLVEYEGDHHRLDRRQWNADIERYALFADAGWRVVRVTAHDLFATPEPVRRKVGLRRPAH